MQVQAAGNTSKDRTGFAAALILLALGVPGSALWPLHS
jgi:hypothetical protein